MLFVLMPSTYYVHWQKLFRKTWEWEKACGKRGTRLKSIFLCKLKPKMNFVDANLNFINGKILNLFIVELMGSVLEMMSRFMVFEHDMNFYRSFEKKGLKIQYSTFVWNLRQGWKVFGKKCSSTIEKNLVQFKIQSKQSSTTIKKSSISLESESFWWKSKI